MDIKVALVGDTGHGKTTLKQAMFEGVKNGCKTDSFRIIDYDTQEDFRKAMASGTLPDGVILVMSMDDIWRDVRDILSVLHAVQIKDIVVFQSKTDLFPDEEEREAFEWEIRELLDEYGFDGDMTAIIQSSAKEAMRTGNYDDIQELLDAVNSVIISSDWFYMTPKFFKYHGDGVIGLGEAERGSVKPGDRLELIGIDEKVYSVTVAEVQDRNGPLKEIAAGGFGGVVLNGVTVKDVKNGQTLITPKSAEASERSHAYIYIKKKEEGGTNVPLFSGRRLTLRYGEAADMPVAVHCLHKQDMHMPGSYEFVEIESALPIARIAGMRFELTDGDTSIAVGRFVG